MAENASSKMLHGANPKYWMDPGPLPPFGGRVPGQKYETRNGGNSSNGKGEESSKGKGQGPPKDPWLEFWKARWTEQCKQQDKEREEMAKQKAKRQNGTERGTAKGKEQEKDPWMEYWKWKWTKHLEEENKAQGKEHRGGKGKGKESVAPSHQNKNSNGKPKSQHSNTPNANSFPAHPPPPPYFSSPPLNSNDHCLTMSYPYYPYGQQGYFPPQGYFSQPNFVPNYVLQNPYASYGYQDPYMNGMEYSNYEVPGYANFDGYNRFAPGDHVKMHVIKSATPPWELEPYAEVPFTAANVPTATTLAELLHGFGATNRDPHKNKCFEVHMGTRGRWYKGMVITGDDQLMMKKRLKDVGWDSSRDGLPGGKPIVCLYFTKG